VVTRASAAASRAVPHYQCRTSRNQALSPVFA